MKHSTATVAKATTMHAGGWSAYSIAAYLNRNGVSVDHTTVLGWVDPKFAADRRRRQALRARRRNAAKTGGRLGAGPARSPEFRLQRMISLRDTGMTFGAIAKVMSFDFPREPVTADDVRDAVRFERPPAAYREIAT